MCWFWDNKSLFLIYTIFATLVCTETKSSARFSPHFQDGLSKKLLILRDFEEKERVKNCIYLLQLQQFIRANFCCIWFSGWGEIYIATRATFQQMRGCRGNVQSLLKLPKNVPNYLQPCNMNNSLAATTFGGGASNFQVERLHTVAQLHTRATLFPNGLLNNLV